MIYCKLKDSIVVVCLVNLSSHANKVLILLLQQNVRSHFDIKPARNDSYALPGACYFARTAYVSGE